MKEPSGVDFIQEGKARIYKTNNEVFYNPAQVFNRDLSIIVIKSFLTLRENTLSNKYFKKINFISNNKSEIDERDSCSIDVLQEKKSHFPITVLEPLGASGLRSIRYLKELSDKIDYLICGDIDPTVIEKMNRNFELNSIPIDRYLCICADAKRLLSIANPRIIKEISNLKNIIETEDSDFRKKLFEDFLTLLMVGDKNKSSGFTVVDIDPYGTCAPFIDSAINACEENGLVCFTATDMPVLCGNVPEVTFYRYGGNALKKSYGHEMSLRLLLNTIISTAAKYQKIAIPLLSVSVDFYVRIFVKIKTSAIQCKENSNSTGFVLQCTNCPSFHIVNFGDKIISNKRKSKMNKNFRSKKVNINCKTQITDSGDLNFERIDTEKGENDENNDNLEINEVVKVKYKANQLNIDLYNNDDNLKCKECLSGKYSIGGPIYTGNLYDKDFVDQILKVCDDVENKDDKSLDGISMIKKIKGLLVAIKDELQNSVLHYHIPSLCTFLGIEMIRPIVIQSALYHLGYDSSHFHRDPLSLKTNAPDKVVLDILRSWALNHSKNKKNISFLDVEIKTKNINFEIHPDLFIFKKKNVPRWLPNPSSNWGPISRPKK